MRWPWQRKASADRLIVSWSAQVFSFVRAQDLGNGQFGVLQMGVERQGIDTQDIFFARLQALGFAGMDAQVMLRPEQYQVLQIESPAVAPEELRSAARYQIREMVDIHIDDITLDVLRVGDGQQKGVGHVFVIVATNAVVREVQNLGKALQWPIAVIDIQETAQRNLQTSLAQKEARADRADAALVVCGERQAVLTISANGELFYTRRLDLPEGFMSMSWSEAVQATPDAVDSYTPVGEYVPGYAADSGIASFSTTGSGEAERAQRVLVEVQRSLDLWDRSWSTMPLAGLRVYAGERSAELAEWLARELGQPVSVMDIRSLFTGLEGVDPDVRAVCAPLLGVLMRTTN